MGTTFGEYATAPTTRGSAISEEREAADGLANEVVQDVRGGSHHGPRPGIPEVPFHAHLAAVRRAAARNPGGHGPHMDGEPPAAGPRARRAGKAGPRARHWPRPVAAQAQAVESSRDLQAPGAAWHQPESAQAVGGHRPARPDVGI